MYKKRIKKWNLDQKNNKTRKQKLPHIEAKSLGFMRPTSAPILSTPALTKTLQLPERTLVMIRNYVTGSFDVGTWSYGTAALGWLISEKGGNDLNALNNMARYHVTACDLLEASLFEEARRVLAKASAEIQNIISTEHPQTLPVLFDVVVTLQKRKRPEIARILLKQFSSMADIVLSNHHPLSQICKCLMIMDSVHFQTILVTAWQSLLDHFRHILGQANDAVSECRVRFSWTVELSNDLERVERSIQGILSKCASTGRLDVSRGSYLLHLKDNLPPYGKYDGAEGICQTMLDLTSRPTSNYWMLWLRSSTLYCFAIVQYAQLQIEAAVLALQQVIDLNVSFRGEQDALTLKALCWLERWLILSGKKAAAAKARNKRRAILDAMDEAFTCIQTSERPKNQGRFTSKKTAASGTLDV